MIRTILSITIINALLFVSSVGATSLDTEIGTIERVTTTQAPVPVEDLSIINISASPLQTGLLTEFAPQTVSMNTPAGFFRTLLSSFTYEIRFTSLGRVDTAIPQALTNAHPTLFSSRLLPHPEKIQSTAVPANQQLNDLPKTSPAPQSQDTNTFEPIFLVSVCLLLSGIMLYFRRRSIKNVSSISKMTTAH